MATPRPNKSIDAAGGPAFPEAIAVSPSGDVYPGMGGMSLRDWFAGQALVLAKDVCLARNGRLQDDLAKCAYEIADAMLEARK